MANACYDIDTGSTTKPCVMGGAGIADVTSSDDYTEGTAFAWQIGTGIGMKSQGTSPSVPAAATSRQ